MTVYFIGAGPGDPDLITVKGARLIADRVLFRGDGVEHNNPVILKRNVITRLHRVQANAGGPQMGIKFR